MYQINKVRTHNKIVIFICLSFLLSACFQKNLPIAQENQTIDWAKRSQRLQALTNWQVTGKAAFQSSRESGSASFEWQQDHAQFIFSAFTPIGSEAFRLTGNDKEAVLSLPDGKKYASPNTEELFLRTVGVAMPLSSLHYWIRGLPDPNYPASSSYDKSNRLAQLQQANWQVNYQSYTNIAGLDLPRFVILTSSLYKAKVMIYNWKLK